MVGVVLGAVRQAVLGGVVGRLGRGGGWRVAPRGGGGLGEGPGAALVQDNLVQEPGVLTLQQPGDQRSLEASPSVICYCGANLRYLKPVRVLSKNICVL